MEAAGWAPCWMGCPNGVSHPPLALLSDLLPSQEPQSRACPFLCVCSCPHLPSTKCVPYTPWLPPLPCGQIYSQAKSHSQPPVSLRGQLLWREFFYTVCPLCFKAPN